jgi:hypothetical protein
MDVSQNSFRNSQDTKSKSELLTAHRKWNKILWISLSKRGKDIVNVVIRFWSKQDIIYRYSGTVLFGRCQCYAITGLPLLHRIVAYCTWMLLSGAVPPWDKSSHALYTGTYEPAIALFPAKERVRSQARSSTERTKAGYSGQVSSFFVP